ncbi:hypothetical protein EVAR_17190_1 [Eumeta japonica]|uniref:Uncharacterized protein n=1 Tax=Eumeta variegata TaxID=151549 RepID=A0A4C1UAC1_EUMVA|nr:hypothetical protein EVAR_17190_1 [Eumeta japonica]
MSAERYRAEEQGRTRLICLYLRRPALEAYLTAADLFESNCMPEREGPRSRLTLYFYWFLASSPTFQEQLVPKPLLYLTVDPKSHPAKELRLQRGA